MADAAGAAGTVGGGAGASATVGSDFGRSTRSTTRETAAFTSISCSSAL